MIPLRDTQPEETYPGITRLLVLANIVVFLLEIQSQGTFPGFIRAYALIPHRFWTTHGWDRWAPVFTSMFLHGGWLHLIANMWALWLFGDNVEDALGHGRFLIFYLTCGVVANIAQSSVDMLSSIPSLGASGAIAGVLGAYLLFYPTARVLTLIPIFIFPWFVELPAVIFLGLWFFAQLSGGLASLGAAGGSTGGIAFWAHVGGFVSGLVLGPLLRLRRR